MRVLLLALTALSLSSTADAQRGRLRDRLGGRHRPPRESRSDDRQSLTYQGTERTYVVRVPVRVQRSSSPAPLVLVLHGGGGNASNAERMFGFTEKAEREGFIVAYPEGLSRGGFPMRTWNADHCCGHAMNSDADDPGFIDALIDRLERDYRIDPRRIYVTGMSNGGMMTHRIGIALADRIAAIAPVVGALFGDERTPSSPVSAIIINGLLDKSVPYDGGLGNGLGAKSWDGTPTIPAGRQATFWAAANHCALSPHRTETATLIKVVYDCPVPSGVTFYTVKDGGHAWPGGIRDQRRGNASSDAPDATDVIWDFFVAHPKR